MCLGGLFVPEAYITATRQYVAQANSWSLEELCLEVNVTTSQSATLDACSFGVTGELESCGVQAQPLAWPFPGASLLLACGPSGPGHRSPGCVLKVTGEGPVAGVHSGRASAFPRRSEASGGHVQQQQAVALQRHLHCPAPHTAALGQANQRREKSQCGEWPPSRLWMGTAATLEPPAWTRTS